MCYRQGDLASLVADKKSCVSEGEGLPGIYDMMKKREIFRFLETFCMFYKSLEVNFANIKKIQHILSNLILYFP